MELSKFVTVSLKPEVANRLREYAKIEKHTLSDELEKILDFYEAKQQMRERQSL